MKQKGKSELKKMKRKENEKKELKEKKKKKLQMNLSNQKIIQIKWIHVEKPTLIK